MGRYCTVLIQDVDKDEDGFTCDWCLDVQYGFLLTQDRCSLIYDSQSDSFLYSALLSQVGLEEIHARFPFAVEHFLHCKAVAQGERDR